MIRVERASWVDVEFMARELPAFCTARDAWHLYPGPKKAREILSDMVANHFAVVAYDGVRPVGFLTAWVGRHSLNPEVRTATQALWWSKGNARVGLLLMDAYVEWGKRNVDHFTATTAGHSGENVLPRRGLRRIEHKWEWVCCSSPVKPGE